MLQTDKCFQYVTFYFCKSVVSGLEKPIVTITARKNLIFKKKSCTWRNWSVFNILAIFQLIQKVLELDFLKTGLNYSYILAIRIQKSTKRSIFLMIFLLRKQFFEKIITRGGRELIVLNPFLDSLCKKKKKNICLTPGIPKTCFQHPQDIVLYLLGLRICYWWFVSWFGNRLHL